MRSQLATQQLQLFNMQNAQSADFGLTVLFFFVNGTGYVLAAASFNLFSDPKFSTLLMASWPRLISVLLSGL